MDKHEIAIEEQLVYWLGGSSVHNRCTDECTPDFSCCDGDISSFEVRLRFVRAYREKDNATINKMLMMFLSDMVIRKFPNCHVVDLGGYINH